MNFGINNDFYYLTVTVRVWLLIANATKDLCVAIHAVALCALPY